MRFILSFYGFSTFALIAVDTAVNWAGDQGAIVATAALIGAVATGAATVVRSIAASYGRQVKDLRVELADERARSDALEAEVRRLYMILAANGITDQKGVA